MKARYIVGAVLAALLIAAAGFLVAQVEPGFTPLFNGKNLDGWKLVGGVGWPDMGNHGPSVACEQ